MVNSAESESTEEREFRLKNLFTQAQSGDKAAYTAVLEEIMEILTRYFRRSLSKFGAAPTQQVSDLVQEAVMAIHLKRATYDSNQPFGPWMFAIARYKLIDFFRKNSRERLADDWEALVTSLIAPENADDANNGNDLETLLKSLPEKQRDYIRKLKIEGRSVQEVARESGVSEGALKIAVHRALKVLRTRAREEFE